MKRTLHTHQLLISALAILVFSHTSIADEADTIQQPPSAEEIAQDTPRLQIKTETIYESSFLPGVRLCEEDEID